MWGAMRLLMLRSVIAGLAALLLMGLAGSVNAAPDRVVTDLRVARHNGATRVVIDANQAMPFRVFALDNPARIVVDMPEVGWRLPAKPLPPATGVYSRVRYGLREPGTSRMVVDLTGPAEVAQAFLLETSPGGTSRAYRLVVDLKQTTAARFRGVVAAPPVEVAERRSSPPPARRVQTASKPAPAPRAVPVAAPAPAKRPAPVAENKSETAAATSLPVPRRKPEPQRPAEKRVVVIDPGHGGPDPGTVGATGRYEKHITLAAAREIKARLNRTGRFRAVVTRDRDVFVKLKQRVKIARDSGADLFISLHADSLRNKSVRGPSVYTLSEKASDREAAQLAERENKSDVIDGVDLSGESPEVTNILIDLAQRETMNNSVQFATLLVRELKIRTKVLRNTHRFAGFRVLKAPDVPSILLEMGFLSNRTDERQLSSKGYRKRIAEAVTRAAVRYFEGVEQARLR